MPSYPRHVADTAMGARDGIKLANGLLEGVDVGSGQGFIERLSLHRTKCMWLG